MTALDLDSDRCEMGYVWLIKLRAYFEPFEKLKVVANEAKIANRFLQIFRNVVVAILNEQNKPVFLTFVECEDCLCEKQIMVALRLYFQ